MKVTTTYSDGIKVIPILTIYLVLNAFWFVSTAFVTYLGFGLVMLSMTILLFLYKIKQKELVLFVFMAVALLFFKLISGYLTNNEAGFGLYISLISGVLLFYLALKYDKSNLILKTLYYFLFLYLIVVLIVLLAGRDPNEIWQGSRNSSSQLFVIMGGVFLIYPAVLEKLKFKLLFYFLIFIVCVLSMGRSGIITSAILLLAAILNFYSFKINKTNLFSIFIALGALLLLVTSFDLLIDYYNSISKFDYLRARGLEDSYRSDMLKEFFEHYNLKVFLFGVDLSVLPYIASFNNNPHNGFLSLHAQTGVLAIIIFFGIILTAIKVSLKRNIVAFLAITAILLRVSTDSINGIILIPMVFLSLSSFYYTNIKKV